MERALTLLAYALVIIVLVLLVLWLGDRVL